VRGPGGRGILTIQTIERAPYETLVTEFQPADLLFIRNDKGRIAHVILWLGVVGVSPNRVPLILDATGGNHEDANGAMIPIGVHIRPFSANSWYAGDFAHAHRIIRGIPSVRTGEAPEAEEGGALDPSSEARTAPPRRRQQMKQRLSALALMVVLGSTLTAAHEPTKAKTAVEAVSLAVAKKHDELGGNSTSISLQVVIADRQILGVDPSSTISEFKDDKGNSLLSTGFSKTKFSGNAFFHKAGNAMVVSVYSNVSPAKGASKILLKGHLVVKCGLDEKTTEEKEVDLKLNTEAKTGDFTLKVTQEKGFAGSGAQFTVTPAGPILKTVKFKDADGKAVEGTLWGSNSDGKSWTQTFSLKKKITIGKFTVTYFSKEEKVTVPVDVEVGIGL
jgi:hypothetical protein